MKQILFFFSVAVTLMSACKNPPISPMEGIYSGKMTSKSWITYSRNIKFKLQDGQFFNLLEGCSGSYEAQNGKITFKPEDASCFCCINCSCIEQVFQSEFIFTYDNNKLILKREQIDHTGTTYKTITFEVQKE